MKYKSVVIYTIGNENGLNYDRHFLQIKINKCDSFQNGIVRIIFEKGID